MPWNNHLSPLRSFPLTQFKRIIIAGINVLQASDKRPSSSFFSSSWKQMPRAKYKNRTSLYGSPPKHFPSLQSPCLKEFLSQMGFLYICKSPVDLYFVDLCSLSWELQACIALYLITTDVLLPFYKFIILVLVFATSCSTSQFRIGVDK